jgi:hypothetical protein
LNESDNGLTHGQDALDGGLTLEIMNPTFYRNVYLKNGEVFLCIQPGLGFCAVFNDAELVPFEGLSDLGGFDLMDILDGEEFVLPREGFSNIHHNDEGVFRIVFLCDVPSPVHIHFLVLG